MRRKILKEVMESRINRVNMLSKYCNIRYKDSDFKRFDLDFIHKLERFDQSYNEMMKLFMDDVKLVEYKRARMEYEKIISGELYVDEVLIYGDSTLKSFSELLMY